METKLSTLCYVEHEGRYLMLHRVLEKNDINEGKWLGVGGHFEECESPEECIVREVFEETGLKLLSYRFRGMVTFVSGKGLTEYMSLFTADRFEDPEGRVFGAETEGADPSRENGGGLTGEHTEPALKDCDEGILKWVEKEKVPDLELWEGDRIFLDLLLKSNRFFSLKFVYDAEDRLLETKLDGELI